MSRRLRVPTVCQSDLTDCGAACLAAVGRFYGLWLPTARVRQLVCTDRQGTTVLGLVTGARAMGLTGRAVRASHDTLPLLPRPAIVHFAPESAQSHFVVIEEIGDKGVLVMDPAEGAHRRMSLADLGRRWSGIVILLAPGADFTPGRHTGSALRQCWHLLAPHRGALAFAVACAATYAVLGVAFAIYVKRLIDEVLISGDQAMLASTTLAMVGAVGGQSAAGALKGLATLHVAQRIDARLGCGVYRHVVALPQTAVDGKGPVELTARLADATTLGEAVGRSAVDGGARAFAILAAGALMLASDWRIALIALGSTALYLLLHVAASGRTARARRMLTAHAAELQAHLVASVAGVETIKRFDAGSTMLSRLDARLRPLLASRARVAVAALAATAVRQVVIQSAALGVLWFGARLVLHHELTPGALISTYTLFAWFSGPPITLAAPVPGHEALDAAHHLAAVMDLQPESRRGVRLPPDAGGVSFHGVTFRYGARRVTLRDVSFDCPRGQVTALVGESGSGRSTIAALLQRLYAPESGQITVGGTDISALDLGDLRAAVAVVPRHVELLDGSVLENVAFGDSAPDVDRAMALCRQLDLARGIERRRGDWHAPLCGAAGYPAHGERQRIGVARALYRRPRVLILDEATAALDPIAEQQIRQIVEAAAAAGTTVIVIANRVAMIHAAQSVVVLAAGAVADIGTHTQLSARQGYYARLVAAEARAAGAVSPNRGSLDSMPA